MSIAPTVSGDFLTRPEGGMEYGADVGAPGLLNAPVQTPLAGRILGYLTGQGWAPGRLLIDTPQGVLGLGHINPAAGLAPGTVVAAGQVVGAIGDSSAYGGTAQSNAHIEAMFAPGVHTIAGATYGAFTGGGQPLAATDAALGLSALGGAGQSASLVSGILGTGIGPTWGPQWVGPLSNPGSAAGQLGAGQLAPDLGNLAASSAGVAAGVISGVTTGIGHGLANALGVGTHDVKLWLEDQAVALTVAAVVLFVLFGPGAMGSRS